MKDKRIVNKLLLASVKNEECTIKNEACFGPTDPDHVTTVGAGGDDVRSNVMPLCRWHHSLKGDKGIGWMIEKFPTYKEWLIEYERQDIIEKVEYKRRNNG